MEKVEVHNYEARSRTVKEFRLCRNKMGIHARPAAMVCAHREQIPCDAVSWRRRGAGETARASWDFMMAAPARARRWKFYPTVTNDAPRMLAERVNSFFARIVPTRRSSLFHRGLRGWGGGGRSNPWISPWKSVVIHSDKNLSRWRWCTARQFLRSARD